MPRSTTKKRVEAYAEINAWRGPKGAIQLVIRGVKNGRVVVTADPSKPNGHPALFGRLDALLRKAAVLPRVIEVEMVRPDKTVEKVLELPIDWGGDRPKGRRKV